MWSDMFYRMSCKGEYYEKDAVLDPEVIKLVPKQLGLIYWDYYHSKQESYDAITAQVDKLKEQVQTLKMKLDEARSRQNVLIARSKMADAAQSAATTISSNSVDSAFAKLDQLERKAAQKEATAEAYQQLNAGDIGLADEFKALQHADAVDTELLRLKEEMGLI